MPDVALLNARPSDARGATEMLHVAASRIADAERRLTGTLMADYPSYVAAFTRLQEARDNHNLLTQVYGKHFKT